MNILIHSLILLVPRHPQVHQARRPHLLLHLMALYQLGRAASRIRKKRDGNRRSKTRLSSFIFTVIDFRTSRRSDRKRSRDKKREYSRERTPQRKERARDFDRGYDRRDADRNRDRDYRGEKGERTVIYRSLCPLKSTMSNS